jgi:hypothetical protein
LLIHKCGIRSMIVSAWGCPREAEMERFVHEENIALYKKLIAEDERNPSLDEDRHKTLLMLLAEEEAKNKKPLAN